MTRRDAGILALCRKYTCTQKVNIRLAPQMLMYQKIMFDRYYCIKTLEILLQTFLFPVLIMAQKSTLPANLLKKPLPGLRLMSSLLCTLLLMTLVFVTAPECLFVKPQSRALIAREHGFVPVKIACDTAF